MRSLSVWFVASLSAALTTACRGQPETRLPKAPTSPTPAAAIIAQSASSGSEGKAAAKPVSYLGVFDDLAAKVEKNHVFATGQRARWDGWRAGLRAEFAAAASRDEALVALRHMQNALGDRHCYLTPPTDLRPTRFSVGFDVFSEVIDNHTNVRIARISESALTTGSDAIAVGDEIVAVDGFATTEWLAARPWESSSLNPTLQREEQASAIVTAYPPWSAARKGTLRTLRFRRGTQEFVRQLPFIRPSSWDSSDEKSLDDAPPIATIGCRSDRTAPYTDFELAAVGTNVCVYRPKAKSPTGNTAGRSEGRKNTRLVRYVSFDYDANGHEDDALRAVRADHELLQRELRAAKAVVLDLHENHGGNNPFVFLSWFANKPWDHQQVHARVSPEFSEDEVRKFLWSDTERIAQYNQALKAGSNEIEWPFLCPKDNRKPGETTCIAKGPREAELVTKAHVALVTGPECTSSCDSFTSDWAAFEMGPVVGLQPGHGYTTTRHGYPVAAPDGRDLGVFRIALSWEAYPRTGKPLEGAEIKLDWEAPYTFETRETWVDLAVKEARKRAEAPR
jgi:hypothetical protein